MSVPSSGPRTPRFPSASVILAGTWVAAAALLVLQPIPDAAAADGASQVLTELPPIKGKVKQKLGGGSAELR